MTRATGGVAAGVTLPVEVLLKSAPAIMASQEARATLSRVASSPVSRMTLRRAGAQASRTARISASLTAMEARPDGKAVATDATATPLPRTAATATAARSG